MPKGAGDPRSCQTKTYVLYHNGSMKGTAQKMAALIIWPHGETAGL